MPENLPRNAPSARLTWLWLTLLLLVLAVSCSGCAAPVPASPPVLFKHSRIQPPDPELMRSPLPAGTYSTSAREKFSTWDSRLKTSPPDSAASRPGPDPQ